MKKLIMILSISIFSFSLVYDFLNEDFEAKVFEISNINQNQKEKEYNLKYAKNKLELEVIFPKLNAGEIYTYTQNEKLLYLPKLKQTVKQSISNQDESIYSILKELTFIKEAKNFSKKDKQFIFEKGILKNIFTENYQISFLKHENKKPTEILFISSNVEIYYKIIYK